MNLCSLPSDRVSSTTLGSIISAAGNNTRIAIGDIYSSKFMEFNFSLLSTRHTNRPNSNKTPDQEKRSAPIWLEMKMEEN